MRFRNGDAATVESKGTMACVISQSLRGDEAPNKEMNGERERERLCLTDCSDLHWNRLRAGKATPTIPTRATPTQHCSLVLSCSSYQHQRHCAAKKALMHIYP